MKYSNRFKSLLFILFILTIIIISFSIITYQKKEGVVVSESRHAINRVITNEMSDFDETKNFDKMINRFVKKWALKGASVAVMRNGKLVYAKGYGFCNIEENKEMEVSNIFRIASVSKLITATAILKLIDDKKLSLNSKVFGENGILHNKYGDKKINDKRVYNITVEHLLRHRGGFTIRGGDPMFNLSLVSSRLKKEQPISTDDIIEYTLARKLGFAPGSSSKYSNIGYLLLSEVIEEVSGSDYEVYVKKEILKPAECEDIHIAENQYNKKYSNEVKYYSTSEDDNQIEGIDGSGELFPKMYGGNDVKGLKGAGAWVASPVELLKFTKAIDGNDDVKDILSKSSISILNTGIKDQMPIGWMKIEPNGRKSRTGSFAGTSAVMQYMPNGVSWAFVSNTSSWVGYRLNNYIMSMMKTAIGSVNKWPDHDLFDPKQVRDLSLKIENEKASEEEAIAGS